MAAGIQTAVLIAIQNYCLMAWLICMIPQAHSTMLIVSVSS